MPYRRRRRYRPRRRRRRYKKSNQQFNSNALWVANKAWSLGSRLAKYINTEIKKHDIQYSVAPSATTGSICLLNGISQGDLDSNRNGNSIKSQYLNIKGKINLNASAANTAVRIMLVLDKNPRMVSMSTAELLTPTTNLGFRKIDNLRRFVVLKDFQMTLSNLELKEKYFEFYTKLKFRTIYELGDTAGTIVAIRNNAIYIVLISDEASLTPTVAFSSRYGYVDN